MVGDMLARLYVRIVPGQGVPAEEMTLVAFASQRDVDDVVDNVVAYGRDSEEGRGYRYISDELLCLDVQLSAYGYHQVYVVVMHSCWACKGGKMEVYDVFSDVGPGQARPLPVTRLLDVAYIVVSLSYNDYALH